MRIAGLATHFTQTIGILSLYRLTLNEQSDDEIIDWLNKAAEGLEPRKRHSLALKLESITRKSTFLSPSRRLFLSVSLLLDAPACLSGLHVTGAHITHMCLCQHLCSLFLSLPLFSASRMCTKRTQFAFVQCAIHARTRSPHTVIVFTCLYSYH